MDVALVSRHSLPSAPFITFISHPFPRRFLGEAFSCLEWQVVGRVAGPCLEGGQVAILRLYAAVCWLRNDCTILPEEGAAHRTDE